jgi:hypothetical protein
MANTVNYSNEEWAKLASDQQQEIAALTAQLQEVTKLAEAAAEEAQEQRDLAEKAGQAIAEEVDKALETKSDSVSEEMKDDLVETVAKIDPDLASDLTDAFAKAEMQDEKIDGEKLGSIVKHVVLDKLSMGRTVYSDGVRKARPADKTASRHDSSNANAMIEARYEERLAQIIGR